MSEEMIVTEACPHCDNEATVVWNPREDGYQIICPNCGEKIMLCSECPKLQKDGFCDWHLGEDSKGSCIMKKPLFTWEELYERALDAGYGSDELTAKDEARHQLRGLIKDTAGYDIEESECAEDCIDSYLQDCERQVLFDESGNIVFPIA